MILERLRVAPAEFERRTGRSIKPQGACKGDQCVPLPARPHFLDRTIPADASPRLRARLELSRRIHVEPDRYVAALRDWVAHGASSRYALGPEEVLRRSRPRPVEEATAAAHFELGQHLYRLGRRDLAVGHFREAHRLQPDNWTYKRQAWSLADPTRGQPTSTRATGCVTSSGSDPSATTHASSWTD